MYLNLNIQIWQRKKVGYTTSKVWNRGAWEWGRSNIPGHIIQTYSLKFSGIYNFLLPVLSSKQVEWNCTFHFTRKMAIYHEAGMNGSKLTKQKLNSVCTKNPRGSSSYIECPKLSDSVAPMVSLLLGTAEVCKAFCFGRWLQMTETILLFFFFPTFIKQEMCILCNNHKAGSLGLPEALNLPVPASGC